MEPEDVIQSRDLEHIYELPLLLLEQGLDEKVLKLLCFPSPEPAAMEQWRSWVSALKKPRQSLHVALVGKYIELKDAYISITEALNHACVYCGVEADMIRVDAELLGKDDVR